jgi:hypothetical protein
MNNKSLTAMKTINRPFVYGISVSGNIKGTALISP